MSALVVEKLELASVAPLDCQRCEPTQASGGDSRRVRPRSALFRSGGRQHLVMGGRHHSATKGDIISFPLMGGFARNQQGISLAVANVPIPAGEAIISISTGPVPHCQGVGEIHNTDPLAIPCPARMTSRHGDAHDTIDLGWVCRVAPVTHSSGAAAFFDAKAKAIHLTALVAGRIVLTAGDGVPCERVVLLG